MRTTPAESWLLLRHGAGDPAWNMAVDEALLEFAAEFARPVLRLYAWSQPAATFGYFQRYAEVAAMTPLRPLVRRPTGGGLVPHDADWTYSLVFPPGHPWFELRATDSYQRLHAWVQESFARLAVDAQLAPCCRKEAPGQCFAGPEKFDVVAAGRKIAGAAQRRNRLGLLIQGSIQPPADIPRARWEESLLVTAGVAWDKPPPAAAFDRRVETLARERYATAAFNQRR
jgi:lipoate-protein ligase A